MERETCKVVAEACCNHCGSFDFAVEMIKSAKICGADYIKFQKRNPDKSTLEHIKNLPHPCPANSYGETYLEHRKFLEFSLDQHKDLKKICEGVGIGYACSVWDQDSARDIISLKPDFIKVPSAMNENYELLSILFEEYDKDIHLSLGMIRVAYQEKLFKYLDNYVHRLVVYHTTSGYPVKFEELYLSEIEGLSERFSTVGFSGHHLGIAADIAAYCLGANWIERHITLDRTWKGTDHSASLEPAGLQRLCRNLKAVEKSLKYKNVDITEDEIKNSEKLKIKTQINW
jgi:sialic acid synthase